MKTITVECSSQIPGLDRRVARLLANCDPAGGRLNSVVKNGIVSVDVPDDFDTDMHLAWVGLVDVQVSGTTLDVTVGVLNDSITVTPDSNYDTEVTVRLIQDESDDTFNLWFDEVTRNGDVESADIPSGYSSSGVIWRCEITPEGKVNHVRY